MKLTRKMAALGAAALAMCLMMTACSSNRENTGVAYEKNMTITSAEDLKGKAVAVQLLSPVDDYVVSNNLTAYPKRYENLENAVEDLADKKVAVIVTDSNYAKKLVEGRDDVKIVDGTIGNLQYHFRFNEADGALAESFNEQIAALKESADYNAMINTELAEGGHYAVTFDGEPEGTATLVTQVGLKPFAYEEDGTVLGFLSVVSDYVSVSCGLNRTFKTVYASEVAETMTAGEPDEHRFCVVVNPEIEEGFVNTEAFYNSELVMIVRADEKK